MLIRIFLRVLVSLLLCQASGASAETDRSPWGIASGAEWSGEYAKFNPLLKDAGVTWLRYFPEWQTIQPSRDEWRWDFADGLLADSKKNNIHLLGVLGFAAKWATVDGSSRTVPLKDINDWGRLTEEAVKRYRNDITYWEIWNEFNGSFSKAPKGQKPEIYAGLIKASYDAAKKVDPNAKIGMTVANFDVAFLDAAIKAGAADHFDFICVHPYENLGAVVKNGWEMGYLSLAGSLRKMLKENGQNEKTPLWITEIGVQSTVMPDAERDSEQADALVQCFVLSLVQGFDKVFWFEARGPAYGKGTDHGIIRADWSLRPAFRALKTMTTLLGPAPQYLGWWNTGGNGYGFVFQGADGPVLVAWAQMGTEVQAGFDGDVQVRDFLGKPSPLTSGQKIKLTRSPFFVTGLPSSLVTQAKGNKDKPFPWGADYSKIDTARVFLGATNREEGIRQTKLPTTEVVQGLDWSARKSTNRKGGEGHYIYFRAEPTFAGFGDRNLEITIVARRQDSAASAAIALNYESMNGYKNVKAGLWEIPAGEQWTEHTWKVDDANFVGAWGWNFRLDAGGSKGEYQIREVRIKKTIIN